MQSSAALVVAVEDAASDLHFDSSIPILEFMLMTYVTDSLRTVRHLGEYVLLDRQNSKRSGHIT